MALRAGVPLTQTNQGDGTVNWANTGNITVQDGQVASANAGAKNATVSTLRCTNFNLVALGRSPVINGVAVVIRRRATTANAAQDQTVSLVLNGAVIGQNKATATAYPTALTDVAYGGTTDLWGNANLQNIINPATGAFNTTFGVDFKPQVNQTTVEIDILAVGVYYTIRNVLYRTTGAWTAVPDFQVRSAGAFVASNEVYVREAGVWVPVYIR